MVKVLETIPDEEKVKERETFPLKKGSLGRYKGTAVKSAKSSRERIIQFALLFQGVKLRSVGRDAIKAVMPLRTVLVDYSRQPTSPTVLTYMCPVPLSQTRHSVPPLDLHHSGPSPGMASLNRLPDNTYSLLWAGLSLL